jgi:hypothetical protein
LEKEKNLFSNKLDFNLRKKWIKCYVWNITFWDAEILKIRKVDQKYVKILKCGAWKGWRRSFGPIIWRAKENCIETRRRETHYVK